MMRTLGTIILAMALSSLAPAQEHPEHPKAKTTPPAETGKADPAEAAVLAATVTGQNICLGCTLKKEQGAAAHCDKYGHHHVLKVTSVEGAEGVPPMKGWVLQYLHNDRSEPYIGGHDGETLTLKGKVYVNERVFEVLPN
jgi:hypothetical protein